jgi:hypothetical protein
MALPTETPAALPAFSHWAVEARPLAAKNQEARLQDEISNGCVPPFLFGISLT